MTSKVDRAYIDIFNDTDWKEVGPTQENWSGKLEWNKIFTMNQFDETELLGYHNQCCCSIWQLFFEIDLLIYAQQSCTHIW